MDSLFEHSDSEENLIKSTGYQIFSLMDSDDLSIPDWWETRLMEWCTGNDDLKYRVLRFVDVLPSLRTPGQVVGHLKEYFAEIDRSFPLALRWSVALTKAPFLSSRAVAAATKMSVARMARHFIAGSNLSEVIRAIRKLESEGMLFTLNFLGEATMSEEEANRYMQRYLDTIVEFALNQKFDNLMDSDIPRINISLKLSSLYSQFDPIDPVGTSAAVKERLRNIFRAAREDGAFVNIDVEEFKYRDLTEQIFMELLKEKEFADFEDAGIVLQSYLRDSGESLNRIINWAKRRLCPITIRLVKGAYWDYENIIALQNGWPVPVFSHKWETDANFEKLTKILLENHEIVRTAIGSHNIRSIAQAIAMQQIMNIPKKSVEYQMLYGMGNPIKKALIQMGRRLRVYVTFGELIPGMAYLVRRILENTSNESFLLQSFIQHIPEDELLKSPAERKENGKTCKENV